MANPFSFPDNFATLDHSNLQSEAIAVTFAFPVLATIAVGLRLYSRSLTRTFGYGTGISKSIPSRELPLIFYR
jgi:hypothetical protein